LIRQGSRGDDRFIRAIRIIKQETVMVHVLHELNLHPYIRGRDNIGGTIIGEGLPNFSQDHVDTLCRSSLADASVQFGTPDKLLLMNYKDLIEVLIDWCQNDDHHMTTAVTMQIYPVVLLVLLFWRGLIAGELRPRPPNQTSQTTSGLIHNSLGRECSSLMEIVLELPNGRPV
jgi:hypothetical protein